MIGQPRESAIIQAETLVREGAARWGVLMAVLKVRRCQGGSYVTLVIADICRNAYEQGISVAELARVLGCTTRTIRRRYAQFRAHHLSRWAFGAAREPMGHLPVKEEPC